MILLTTKLQTSTFYRVKKSKWVQETLPVTHFDFLNHIIRETRSAATVTSGVFWRVKSFEILCDL